jgi:hypothetical protein
MGEANPPDGGIDEYNRKLQELKSANVEPAARRNDTPRRAPGFFVLGFLTPFVLSAIVSPLGSYSDLFSAVAPVLGVALFIVFAVLVIVGRGRGDARIVSFGKGGLWAYAFVMLAGLLIFGSCLVILRGSNL